MGYEIYLRDGSRGEELWEKVMAAGKPYQIRPIAPSEARRIEAGMFNYSADMTLENNPIELTGLERLVELDQEADFIGRKALEGIKAEGVRRKLVGVNIEGDPMMRWLQDFWPVRKDGRPVGRLTSGTWSPGLDKNIGYAWVPIGLAERGTTLEIESPDGILSAQVASLPFVDPKKRIPNS